MNRQSEKVYQVQLNTYVLNMYAAYPDPLLPASKFHSFNQQNPLYALFLQMQESFSFLVLHKIFKVLVRLKFYQVNFMWVLHITF